MMVGGAVVHFGSQVALDTTRSFLVKSLVRIAFSFLGTLLVAQLVYA